MPSFYSTPDAELIPSAVLLVLWIVSLYSHALGRYLQGWYVQLQGVSDIEDRSCGLHEETRIRHVFGKLEKSSELDDRQLFANICDPGIEAPAELANRFSLQQFLDLHTSVLLAYPVRQNAKDGR